MARPTSPANLRYREREVMGTGEAENGSSGDEGAGIVMGEPPRFGRGGVKYEPVGGSAGSGGGSSSSSSSSSSSHGGSGVGVSVGAEPESAQSVNRTQLVCVALALLVALGLVFRHSAFLTSPWGASSAGRPDRLEVSSWNLAAIIHWLYEGARTTSRPGGGARSEGKRHTDPT
jgi:hypothetical protein